MLGDNATKVLYTCTECKTVFGVYRGKVVSKCPNCKGERIEELVKTKVEGIVTK